MLTALPGPIALMPNPPRQPADAEAAETTARILLETKAVLFSPDKPFTLYIRKKPKGFGRNAQIEGELAEGQRVLLVEDLASEGTSKLNFVNAIRSAGGQIGHTFVIFHYGIFPQSVDSLAAEKIALHALATWWDVLAVAESLGYFTSAQFAAVKSFLDDPDKWSAPTGAEKTRV